MFKYVCKRIGLFIMSLFIIMTMLFVLIRMLPNPVIAVTGGYAKQLEDMRIAWGQYDPIIVQYLFHSVRHYFRYNCRRVQKQVAGSGHQRLYHDFYLHSFICICSFASVLGRL